MKIKKKKKILKFICFLLYLTFFSLLIYIGWVILPQSIIYFFPIPLFSDQVISLLIFYSLIFLMIYKCIIIIKSRELSLYNKIQNISFMLITPILFLIKFIINFYSIINPIKTISMFSFLEVGRIFNNYCMNINVLSFSDIDCLPVTTEDLSSVEVSSNFLGLTTTQWVIVGCVVVVTVGLGCLVYCYWTTASIVTVASSPTVIEESVPVVLESLAIPVMGEVEPLVLVTNPAEQLRLIYQLCMPDITAWQLLAEIIRKFKAGVHIETYQFQILVDMCTKHKFINPDQAPEQLFEAVETVIMNLPL